MKKLLVLPVLVCASQLEATALTVKSDFLRVAQVVRHAKFPLDLDGYLDLSFRLDINEEDQNGVKASVDRLVDGSIVDTYKGFIAFGKQTSVEFSDGSIGPKLLLEPEEKREVEKEVPAEGLK
jgi:hypothetical protein